MGAPSFRRTRPQLQARAKDGDAVAQNTLGDCHYYGKGVPQSYADAVIWYHKAAEQGLAEAQNNLGDCYFKGISFQKRRVLLKE